MGPMDTETLTFSAKTEKVVSVCVHMSHTVPDTDTNKTSFRNQLGRPQKSFTASVAIEYIFEPKKASGIQEWKEWKEERAGSVTGYIHNHIYPTPLV